MSIPLYEQIYNHILSEIENGELKAGDRVPSEKELAEKFKVSRITTKKALELLVQKGAVERMRGKGSFVSAEPGAGMAGKTPFESRAVPTEGKKVGLILPDFGDSYGADLFRAIEGRCAEEDYQLIVRLTHDSRETEEKSIQSLIRHGVHGLVIFPVHGEHYNEQLIRLVIEDFPVVLVDRYLKGIAARSVSSDNFAAANALTRYLIGKGHQNIAFISPPPENTSTIEDRMNGFKEALLENGLARDAYYLLNNLVSTMPAQNRQLRQDIAILEAFIQNHPEITAVVACEYNLAVLVDQVLKNTGADTAQKEVVCFDNPEHYGAPYFAHIRQNEEQLGRKAVDILQALWFGEEAPMQTLIDFELIPKKNSLT